MTWRAGCFTIMGDPIRIEIAEKSGELRVAVMELLHQYPDRFVHGVFESHAEKDFAVSEIAVARSGDEVMGCLMFDRPASEYKWLAVRRGRQLPKAAIARRLFEVFYPTLAPGTTVRIFVNTEDSSVVGHPEFSGKNFESARNLYRSMGLEFREDCRINDYYGPGSHVYRVEWVP